MDLIRTENWLDRVDNLMSKEEREWIDHELDRQVGERQG